MNNMSQLLRRIPFQMPSRKKISGVNMQMRKEVRRMKKLNTYSREFTGEQNQHGWFTPKRFKALGQFLEAGRNVHPGSLPIKQQLKKEISQKFKDDSDWMYYKYRNYISQALVQKQIKATSITPQQISQLPAHFRDFMNQDQEEEDVPKIANAVFTLNPQRNVYLPMDERYRINLILKIDNPPQNKDEQELKQDQ